jgi:ferredoxin
MNKFTVGSLKFDTITTDSSDKTIFRDTPATVEASKRLAVKQNRRYFQIDVKNGQSILEAALEQKLSLDYKCKKGTCGKCKVMVVNGSNDLQQANSLEEKNLINLIENGFRLACQAKVR